MCFYTIQTTAPASFGDILSREGQALLGQVWRNQAETTALTAAVRRQLAAHYRAVGDRNPPGSAQQLFQYARADFLVGQGPNPGPSVNEFAAAHGCTKAYKSGPRCNT